ncbi:oxidoreductase NAD-binding domain protein, partial [Cooperia oncophora]
LKAFVLFQSSTYFYSLSNFHGSIVYIYRSSVDDGRFISRPYTPTKVTRSLFEVPIKIVSDGRLSLHIRHWKVGDEIEWRGPYGGDVIWSNHKVTRLLLVAGGVGIAPFIRVLDELLKNEETEIRIRLVYCVRHGSDILFKELLSQWAHHWNVEIIIFGANVELKFSEIAKHHMKWNKSNYCVDEIIHIIMTLQMEAVGQ